MTVLCTDFYRFCEYHHYNMQAIALKYPWCTHWLYRSWLLPGPTRGSCLSHFYRTRSRVGGGFCGWVCKCNPRWRLYPREARRWVLAEADRGDTQVVLSTRWRHSMGIYSSWAWYVKFYYLYFLKLRGEIALKSELVQVEFERENQALWMIPPLCVTPMKYSRSFVSASHVPRKNEILPQKS